MRVGVLLLPTEPWSETAARVRRLEALGYDSVWTYDHVSWRRYRGRPWWDAMVWLTAVAGVTARVGLGTMVASPNVRHPVTLAAAAGSVQEVSGGRFTLGVGAGGTGFDATVLGGAALGPAERAERLAELVGVLCGLRSGPVNQRGRWFSAVDADVQPRPDVPVAVASDGGATLDVVARWGDGWITHGPDLSARARARLDDACAAVGRDPSSLRRIDLAGVTDDRPLASVAALDDFVGRAAAAGFSDLVVHHPRPDDPVWNEPESILEDVAGRWR